MSSLYEKGARLSIRYGGCPGGDEKGGAARAIVSGGGDGNFLKFGAVMQESRFCSDQWTILAGRNRSLMAGKL